MTRTIVLIAATALLVGCGGRIQPTQDGTDDSTTGTTRGGGQGGSSSSGASGDPTSGGGFGNGGSPGGSGSAGSGGGSMPPLTLALGQCLLGASGAPSFPDVVGTAGGHIGASGPTVQVTCDVQSNDAYHFMLVPTRSPTSPATLHGEGTLSMWQGNCGCPLCDCVQQTLGTTTCSITPSEDDDTIYHASFVCDFPPRGEDLPGTHLTGAIYVHPLSSFGAK